MAKSKFVQVNKKIEEKLVGGYKKIEKNVTEGYEKVENKFVDQYLTHDNESIEDAKIRLKAQHKQSQNVQEIERGNKR